MYADNELINIQLHDTENENLELATSAQNYINKLKSTITKYEEETKVLNERIDFLTSEIVQMDSVYRQVHAENTCLRIQICKINKETMHKTKELIECNHKIINLQDALKKHKNEFISNFREAISVSNKRAKLD